MIAASNTITRSAGIPSRIALKRAEVELAPIFYWASAGECITFIWIRVGGLCEACGACLILVSGLWD